MELGCIDIVTEVYLLSSHLFLPREGHLYAACHFFAHLALNHNARVVCDPTHPQIDEGVLINTNWKAMYGDVNEAALIDAISPLGKEVDLCLYVISDHAGEDFTWCSRTGFVIYLNTAQIVWFYKKQPARESSVFEAECVAIKNDIETICWICYTL
jgi:hypothetical protein